MGDRTSIEWTRNADGSAGATLNAWTGCRKTSAGCANCYITRQPPLRIAGRKWVKGATLAPDGSGPVVYHLERIDKMVRRKKPTVYFVNSLSDVFLEDVPDEAIALLFAGMVLAPQHTFQVLTKRPERMKQLLMDGTLDGFWNKHVRDGLAQLAPDRWMHYWPVALPLPNVWLGVTVENRAQVKRADLLRETTVGAVRFLSCEPLLGPLVHDCWRAQGGMLVPGPGHYREGVDEPAVAARSAWLDERVGGPRRPQLDLAGMDWVIAGGESGPGARPCREEWLRDLRDACERESLRRIQWRDPGPVPELGEVPAWAFSDVPRPCRFFLKQLGGHPDKRGGDKALLDGELHHAMPPVRDPAVA